MDYAKIRKSMVESQIKKREIKDKKVIAAMLKVPRHEFIPPEYINDSYEDFPVPIGTGQTISQPYIVALMTELLELKGKEKVLEIGTGSGYQSAILAEIVEEVYTIEKIRDLSEKSARLLSKYKNIRTIIGDGKKGYPEKAPYDAIIVTAAASEIPETLKGQLKEGGIIVVPVGNQAYQKLVKLRKIKGIFEEKQICDVRFVPLV